MNQNTFQIINENKEQINEKIHAQQEKQNTRMEYN